MMPNERGAALVVALMAMMLIAALGAALVLISSTETLLADTFRASEEAVAAADAAAARAAADLSTVADWSALPAGPASSTFVDGQPGVRILADGTSIDLNQIVSLANCQQVTACSAADMDAVTADRPWGPNNPRWRLFAHGPLSDLLPAGEGPSPFYAVVMLADDPAETDNDPLQDGRDPSNPGSGLLLLRAEAFGPQAAHRAVELTLARTVRVAAWRELR